MNDTYSRWSNDNKTWNDQKITDSKFGNCDHFSKWVIQGFQKADYQKGGFGIITIYFPNIRGIGHNLNYITSDRRVLIVDAWKNIYCDLSHFDKMYSEYCYKEKVEPGKKDENVRKNLGTYLNEDKTTAKKEYSDYEFSITPRQCCKLYVINRLWHSSKDGFLKLTQALHIINNLYTKPEDNNMLKPCVI